jgi:hypothetical protein
MGDRTSELKRRVATERDQLHGSLEELEMKAKSLVDWRTQFAAHPLPMLAAAFGGGLLLSGILADSGRRGNGAADDDFDDDYDDEDDIDEDAEYGDESYMPSAAPRRRSRARRGNRFVDELKGALMGVAATRAVQFLDGMIPGVKAEVEDRRSRR